MDLMAEMARQKAAREAAKQPAPQIPIMQNVLHEKKASPLDALLTKKPAPIAPQPETKTNGSSEPLADGRAIDTATSADLDGLAALLPAKAGTQAQPEQPAKKPSPLDRLTLGKARTGEPARPATRLVAQPATVQTNPPPSLTGDTKASVSDIKIPAGASDEQRLAIEELRGQVKFLIANIDSKDQVSGVVRSIMTKLQANPDLCVFFPDVDMNAVVRGARGSYKFQARAKEEKATKKTKKASAVSELSAEMAAMGLDFNL